MHVWDMDDRIWRDWPVKSSWRLEWYSDPVRPNSMSDEDWECELDMHGPDLAVAHALRVFGTQEAALKKAHHILSSKPNYYGQVGVYPEYADLVEPGVMTWASAGDPCYAD